MTGVQTCALPICCQPLLVLTGKGVKTQAEGNLTDGTVIFHDLAEAVDFILTKGKA